MAYISRKPTAVIWLEEYERFLEREKQLDAVYNNLCIILTDYEQEHKDPLIFYSQVVALVNELISI